jgi:TRAP-type mannitol/chloroaromatic compound transport system permease small subunit
MTAFIFAGWKYAEQSLRFKEVSVMSPANVPIFQFKLLIPIVGALMILQGLAQVARCIVCLRTGAWPEHIADVEETESIILHQHQDQAAHQGDGSEGGSKP